MPDSTDSPVVSAMMPAFNEERLIVPAIRSIIGQTFRRWELIVVDDGSTDATADVVSELARSDPRVRLIQAAHGGRGRARQLALEAALGTYIAICDADDISAPERFELQVEALGKEPDLTAVGSFVRRFIDDPSDATAVPDRYPVTVGGAAAMFDKRRMGIAHSSAMIQRTAIEEAGGYSSELLRSQDLALFLRMHRAGARVRTIPRVLVYYRRGRDRGSYAHFREAKRFRWRAMESSGVLRDLSPRYLVAYRWCYRRYLSRYIWYRAKMAVRGGPS